MTPLNGFLEVGMYGDSAGLRLRGRCGRRGACVRTGVCTVRRALESAYGNRKKYRKRRKTKEKARCGGMNAAGLVEPTVVETATSSMRTKRSTN